MPPPTFPKPIEQPTEADVSDESSCGASSAMSDGDDDVDYVKKWQEEASNPAPSHPLIKPFDEDRMLNEIKFLSFDEKLEKYFAAESSLLEKLDLANGLRTLLFSGKLAGVSPKKDTDLKGEPENATGAPKTDNFVDDTATDNSKTDEMPPKVGPFLKVSTQLFRTSPESPAAATSGQDDSSAADGAVEASFEMSPDAEEDDNSIRDILADIQDSYERQLDEEFSDISQSSPFVEPAFFNPNVLEIDPSEMSAEPDLPCIVDAWTEPSPANSHSFFSGSDSQALYQHHLGDSSSSNLDGSSFQPF